MYHYRCEQEEGSKLSLASDLFKISRMDQIRALMFAVGEKITFVIFIIKLKM